ncbi:hypothetical protein E2C01_060491 [Portunus trituberculatus]|uniref:Uncharacterized protein n=1 Tax=Portunus trituberculatus TaxID=210409 RepID=A0A5B7HC87_PORTR|nr:hypothetical protein [Portunus trituberculatus]
MTPNPTEDNTQNRMYKETKRKMIELQQGPEKRYLNTDEYYP